GTAERNHKRGEGDRHAACRVRGRAHRRLLRGRLGLGRSWSGTIGACAATPPISNDKSFLWFSRHGCLRGCCTEWVGPTALAAYHRVLAGATRGRAMGTRYNSAFQTRLEPQGCPSAFKN